MKLNLPLYAATCQPATTSAGTLNGSRKTLLATLFFLIVFVMQGWGQATYTWNLAGGGSWATAANWTPTRTTPAANDILVIGGAGAKAITDVPTQTIGRLEITGTTSVTLSAGGGSQTLTIGNGTGDDLIVSSGTSLTIASSLENVVLAASATADISGTYTNNSIYNTSAASTVTTVTGTFSNASTITGATAAKLVFASGGTYQHTQNGGTVPTATWDANSNCNITGMTTTYPSGMGQTFGNVAFAGTNLNVVMTSNLTCQGDLTLNYTSISGHFRFAHDDTRTITVGGNFLKQGSGQLTGSTGEGNVTITVTGNFSWETGTFVGKINNGVPTITIGGNYSLTGGTMQLRNTSSGGASVLNVAGDFSVTGGTLSTTSGASSINFNGDGTPQIYTSGSTLSGTLNFTVNSGAFLQMAAAGTTVSGGGSFTLSNGATLGIRSTAGITSSGATGNVQVTGTRTFNTGANYVYNGTIAQNTGNGLPATVNNLTFDNTGGAVTLNSARNISSVFSITTGSVANLGTFTHTAASLVLGGVGQINGSWGHPSSPATNTNSTFFANATGIVNVTGTNTFSNSGTFMVPPGVTSITIQTWGGGGAGGGRNNSGNGGAGGGGGGAYASSIVPVTPGDVLTVNVAQAKAGVSGNTAGPNGDPSSVLDPSAIVLVLAAGGAGGAGGTGGAGGAGGAAAASTGDVKFNGGNGANGIAGGSNNSGAGGGGAGTTGDGGNASGTTAGTGTAVGGGNGGAGVTGNAAGNSGSTFGGGGSGAKRTGGGPFSGGGGAPGQVIISWFVCPTITTTAGSNSPVCEGEDLLLTAADGTGGTPPYQYNWEGPGGYTSNEQNPTRANATLAMSGTYTVTVTDDNGCTGTSSVTVTVNPNVTPTVSIVANPGNTICDGESVTFTATANNTGGGTVNYDFQVDNVSVQSGASNTYMTSALADGEEVTCEITVTGGTCLTTTTATSNTITMTVNDLPTTFNVTGGGAYCAGGAGVPVGLSGSQTGVDYQLQIGGVDTGSPVAGDGNAISFGNQTAAGTYTVVATNTTTLCTATMTGDAVVTINPAPTAFNVTGGGAYCTGGAGVPVGLSGSETGVDYQLQIGGVDTGTPVAGDGNAISFGNQTAAGTYTIVATNTTTLCTATMTGNAVVTVNPLPTTFNVTGGGAYCAGGAGVPVGLSGSETGVNYQLQIGGVDTGTPIAGDGNAISFGNQTAAGTYTVVATNTTTLCTATMTGDAVVTINAAPTCDITGLDIVCTNSEDNLYEAPTGMTSYQWSITGNGTIDGPDDEETVLVDAGATGTFELTLVITGANGCTSTCTKTVTVAPLPTLTLTVDAPANATCGDIVDITIEVSNSFTDISSLQFSVEWDEAKLMYQSYVAPEIGGTGGDPIVGDVDAVTNGELTFTWLDPDPNAEFDGVDLSDGTVILTLTMKVIGSTGNVAVSVTDNPEPREVVDANFCSNTVISVDASIALSPITVTCPSNTTVCIDVAPFALTGGTPSGGTYSGPGVSAGIFNPVSAGTGPHIITYSYTDAMGCSNTCTFEITVNPLPTTFNVTGGGAYCAGGAGVPVGLSGSETGVNYQLQIGGVDTGTPIAGDGNAISFGNQTAAGTYTVVATNTTTLCTATMTGDAVVTINAAPTCDITGLDIVCTNSEDNLYEAPTGMTSYQWSITGNGTIDGPDDEETVLVDAGATGTFELTLVITGANGCTSTCTKTVTVAPLPTLTLTVDAPANATCGDIVDITIEVSNSFTDISSLQFSVEWDEAKLMYQSYVAPEIGGTGGDPIVGDVDAVTNGELTFTWLDPDPNAEFDGVDLSDGTVILTLTMKVIGSTGNVAVSVTDNPEPREVVDANFCSNTVISVDASIALSPITVTCPSNTTVCIDVAPFALTGGTPSGGTYSGPGVSAGIFNPVSAGTGPHIITYSYTDAMGCSNTCTFEITVNPLPTTFNVTGGGAYCAGGAGVPVGLSGSETGVNYQLQIGGVDTGTPIAGDGNAISFGNQTAAGTYTVVATNTTTLCTATMTGDAVVTVNPLPTPSFTAEPGANTCLNTDVTYTTQSGQSNYVWNVPGTAGVDYNITSGGIGGTDHTVTLQWLTTGGKTVTVNYEDANGCSGASPASNTTTVDPNVNAGTVSGTTPLCISDVTTYTTTGDAGGVWSSTNTGVATVDASTGEVTAVGAGTTDITYTISTGCGAPVSAFQTLTVNPNVNAGTVSGTTPLCISDVTTYTTTGDAGGVWSSTNTGVATVDASTGEVTAVGAGTTDITYTISTGCGAPVSAFQTLTVNPNVNAGTVSGTTPLCISDVTTYTTTGDAGGVWSSTNTGVATVDASTGEVTAVGAGTTDITYTISTGCGAPVSAFQTLTVNPNVNAGTVSGTTPLCISDVTTYTTTGDAGGVWSSTNTGVATVDAFTGEVTAVGAGTTDITYTISTGCGAPVSAFQTLTVELPDINVIGNSVSITDGDLTPDVADDTNFGCVEVTGGTVTHTFTIENTTSCPLTLTGTPYIVISGVHAGDFTVTVQPAGPTVTNGNPLTFEVEFDPSVAGVRDATVIIASDDPDENPFTFSIRGYGVDLTASLDPNVNPICEGSSTTLTLTVGGSTGPFTYDWMPNTLSGAGPHIVSPVITTNYSVVVTDVNGCTVDAATSVTVIAQPAITNPGPQTACDSYTLPTITGSNLVNPKYYDDSQANGGQEILGPITSSMTVWIYDETGTVPNCTDEESFTVTINNTPSITNPGPQTACDSYTLPTITGSNLVAPKYYDDSQANGGQEILGPITSSMTVWIYDETGTVPNCSDEESFVVTINNTPSITNPGPQTACDSYTLPTITGSNLVNPKYYDDSQANGGQEILGPITATMTVWIYDETGTVPNCSDEESFTVTINLTPAITNPGPQTACDSYTLPTIMGSNLVNPKYYDDSQANGGQEILGPITATTTVWIYDETGTVPNCSDEESFVVTINNTPSITNPGTQTACDSYTLPTIMGSNLVNPKYYDDSQANGGQEILGPITATTTVWIYDETGTVPNCSDEESFTVTINNTPSITNPGPQTACDSYALPTITGSNLVAPKYYDDSQANGGQEILGPITATTTVWIYDETGTVPNCSDEESFVVTINNTPSITNPGPQTACDSYTLPTIMGSNLVNPKYYDDSQANGGQEILGPITSSMTVWIYDETGTVPNCSDEESFVVTINLTPAITNPGPQTACDSYTLPAITGSNLVNPKYYDDSQANGGQEILGPITSSMTVWIYDETGTVPNCSDEESFVVTINNTPSITNPGPQTACDSYTLPTITGSNLVAPKYYDDSQANGGQEILGPITSSMTVWIYDETGTAPNCSDEESFVVTITPCAINFSGRIIWEATRLTTMTGVNEVTTDLTGDDTDTDLTGVTGDFLLVANSGSDFELTPVKNVPMPFALNGVTTADASRITQHALNILPITDPYKLIAADVNTSNSITTADASFITQAVLGNPVFQLAFINKTWRFVPKDYVFPIPASPWGYPQSIVYTGISGDQTDQDFIGVKMGDVNNTANPANFGGQLAPNLIWRVQDRLLQQGETFVAEFRADNLYDLLAYQFGMLFDVTKLELLEIETISGSPMGEDNFGLYNLAAGEIRAALALAQAITLEDGTAVFRLKFKVLEGGSKLSTVLHITNDVLLAEAYRSDYTPGPVSLVYSGITTSTGEPDMGKLVLLQNRPNPFQGRTVIGFELPGACDATLRVFDTKGRLLREHSAFYPAGSHQVEFDFDTERETGVLYYDLTTPFGVLAKKMVLTRE
ncbi:MAG: hypothetical protein KF734_19890 [Saprospiraceae bacterium]|nr:hypothetical protein [Saprospiraceae bacterium]